MSHNIAASVHQRLLNHARAHGRPFDELLHYFVIERFLYRLGCSPYASDFVLKGALMFGVWQGPLSRPTRDVDLLGHMDNQAESVIQVIRAICRQPLQKDDGLRFDTETMSGATITEGAQYHGVRVRLLVKLGKARVRLQVDTGFGDIVVPGATQVRLPVLLDFPPPKVQGYTRESTIAEKFQAIIYLGAINSRMKDFYDIWLLATRFRFDGSILARAIRETFSQRQTTLQSAPVAFTATFADDPRKQAQWVAFTQRHPYEPAPPTLDAAINVIASLLQPVVRARIDGQSFNLVWHPGGPWREARYKPKG